MNTPAILFLPGVPEGRRVGQSAVRFHALSWREWLGVWDDAPAEHGARISATYAP